MKLFLIGTTLFFYFMTFSYGQFPLHIENTTSHISLLIDNDAIGQGDTYGVVTYNTKNENDADVFGYWSSVNNAGSGLTNKSYSMYGTNNSNGFGEGYGGYFKASVGPLMSNAYGVYGYAEGAINNYSGFFEGKIGLDNDLSDESNAIIDQTSTYINANGPQIFNTDSSNPAYSLMATANLGSNESYGFYGDGDFLSLWSPGDGDAAYGVPFGTLLAISDSDGFDGLDSNPFNNNALKFYLTEAGGWIASDINRKENIVPYGQALDRIKALDVYTYTYKLSLEEVAKGQENLEIVGLIAQEIQEVIPHAIEETVHGELFVNYNQVTAVLLAAVKELEARVAELEAKLEKE